MYAQAAKMRIHHSSIFVCVHIPTFPVQSEGRGSLDPSACSHDSSVTLNNPLGKLRCTALPVTA